jgi:hypothetical protein
MTGGSVASTAGGGGANNDMSSARKIRRGLHISSSEGLMVQCTQPVSIIITIPLAREPITPADDDNSVGRITQPWSYVRELHPIRNAGGAALTAEQIEEEELEASSFANILMSLEQLLSELPNSCTQLKICISCGDRTQRDALACVVRGLNCQPLGTTLPDRLAVMPWNVVKRLQKVSDNTADKAATDKANSIQELAKRLKELELENSQLRKERFDITATTVPQHQPLQRRNSKSAVTESLATVTEDAEENEILPGENLRTDGSGVRSLASPSSDSQDATTESNESEVISPTAISSNSAYAASEASRVLSAKVLELEKKLAVSARREAEAAKLRQQVDNRTNIVQAENERVRAAIVIMEAQTAEATAELASQRQICKDLKDTLEKECEEHKSARVLVKELDELRPTLVVKDATIKELT